MSFEWVNITPSISWIEITWTLIALLGLFYASSNTRNVWRDLDAVRPIRPRNGRWLVAKAALRIEMQRLLSQIGYIVIGLLSMTLAADYTEPARAAVGFVLAILGISHTVHSYLDGKLRRELVQQGQGPHGLGDDAFVSASPHGAVPEHTHHLNFEPIRPQRSGQVEAQSQDDTQA